MSDSNNGLIVPLGALWAKLSRDAAQKITGWHSLVDHSADVAAVLEALLDQPTIAHRLARTAGTQELDGPTRARLTALAFLHDVGKANRGFRRRVDPRAFPIVGHIDQLAWLFFNQSGSIYYKRLNAMLGLDRIVTWFAKDSSMALWHTVFAHHGRPWDRDPANANAHWEPRSDGSDPIADLAPMRVALDAWFPEAFTAGAIPLSEEPAFHHAFAGLLMLADWLGSDPQFFPFAHGAAKDRWAFARASARMALAAVGLAVEPRRDGVRARRINFSDLFAGNPPRSIQRDAVVPDAPCVVLEAETGSGKTEAALWRFKELFAAGAVDGLYFALPTRVAATQIFARVKRFRDCLFPSEDRPAVVLAVPGQAGADDATVRALPDFNFEWSDQPDAAVLRARWAAEHPKRFLGAQIAVGTLDQALLGAIATRHAHLRATLLLRHLLVVDEVHASDRYMETLLENLLRGHVQAGGHALLLSATLGAGMRARLLGTPCPPLAEAEAASYPALSWAENGRAICMAVVATGVDKTVGIEPTPLIDDPAAIAAAALHAAEAGAKVLVIRNTVAAAITTAQKLEAAAGGSHPALFRVDEVPTLHHGRYAPSDRVLLDAAVERALGKDSPPCGIVVIGTQTLEQSLDLDADLLITDFCPADVLLQRIGRLHRHAGRPRPAGFAQARAIVLTPAKRALLTLLRGRQGRHGLGLVYDDPRIMEATWRLVEAAPEWRIPEMNRQIVEQTTHPERLETIEAELIAADPTWRQLLDEHYGAGLGRQQQAYRGLLNRAAPFSDFHLDADDRIATRLGAKDLLAALPEAVMGPFGKLVRMIRVPHWLAGAATEKDTVTLLDTGAIGLRFRLGPTTLRYDRFGLQREVS